MGDDFKALVDGHRAQREAAENAKRTRDEEASAANAAAIEFFDTDIDPAMERIVSEYVDTLFDMAYQRPSGSRDGVLTLNMKTGDRRQEYTVSKLRISGGGNVVSFSVEVVGMSSKMTGTLSGASELRPISRESFSDGRMREAVLRFIQEVLKLNP